jgi:hypothetical protein
VPASVVRSQNDRTPTRIGNVRTFLYGRANGKCQVTKKSFDMALKWQWVRLHARLP